MHIVKATASEPKGALEPANQVVSSKDRASPDLRSGSASAHAPRLDPTRRRVGRERTSVPVKITPPRLTNVYARQRLYSWLDEGSDHRMVWIDGPPGAGKTTIAASYIKARQRSALWYQVDAGDTDLATFFHYLGMAVAGAAPRHSTPMPSLTLEYLAGVETFAQRFFEELDRRLPAKTTLVFDSLHEVAVEHPLHAALRAGIERLQDQRKVFLLSRDSAPPAYARLIVHGRMATLTQDLLLLTEAEAVGIAALHGCTGRTVVEHLRKQAAGWMAGFILLLHGGSHAAERASVVGNVNAQPLFDYFASEVFERRPPAVKRLLMLTALFPSFTAKMADRMTGMRGSATALRDVVRHHHFIEDHARDADSYQYHPLYRQFLLARAIEHWGELKAERLKRRAAAVLEWAQQPEQALALYRSVSDWSATIRILLTLAPQLMREARIQTLASWIGEAPPLVMEKHAWLLYWRGMCRLVTSPVDARADFERAYGRFDALDDPNGLYATWAAVCNTLLIEWRDFMAVDRWVDVLASLRIRHPHVPVELGDAITGAAICVLTNRKMSHPDLGEWLSRADEIIARTSLSADSMWWEMQLCHHYLWMGWPDRAATIARRFESMRDTASLNPMLQVLYHLVLSTYYWCVGEAALAIRHVDKGSQVTGLHSLSHLVFRIYGQGVYASLVSGDVDAASRYLIEMHSQAPVRERLDAAFYHHLSSLVETHRADWDQAERHAHRAVTLASQTGQQFASITCEVQRAVVLILQGQYDAGRESLQIVRAAFEETRSRVMHLWICFVEALPGFSGSVDQIDRHKLGDALRLSRELRGHGFPWFSHRVLAQLYAVALREGIETDHVRELIVRFGVEPPRDAYALAQWPFGIEVRTFGPFSVTVKQQPLKFTTKTQKKPLELLKALIALGGTCVREEKLAELLWPDSEADDAAHALTTALYRLRKLLGGAAIERRDGALTLSARVCRVDLWVLERLLAELSQACERQDLDRVARLAHEMLISYQSSFLESEGDAPWIVSVRERLRSKMLRHLKSATKGLNQGGRIEQAIACYERALELDSLDESSYRGLMRCYLTQQRPVDALRTYNRCRDALRGLGVNPSAETEALVRRDEVGTSRT